jgi:hypothetical protein
MSMKRRALIRTLPFAIAAAALSQFPATVLAQETPLKILVGFPAGGSIDTIARSLAAELTTLLKRPVVVENRPGAGGQIAAVALKGAAPDGNTLFLTNSHTVSMIPLTVRSPGFEPAKDFAPVSMVAMSPDVLGREREAGRRKRRPARIHRVGQGQSGQGECRRTGAGQRPRFRREDDGQDVQDRLELGLLSRGRPGRAGPDRRADRRRHRLGGGR